MEVLISCRIFIAAQRKLLYSREFDIVASEQLKPVAQPSAPQPFIPKPQHAA